MKRSVCAFVVLGLAAVNALDCGPDEVQKTTCPRMSEPTCRNPTATPRLSCPTPECYCKPPMLRDKVTGNCFNREDCPDFSFIFKILELLKVDDFF